MSKKNIVLSAINFFEGGPLSVLKDCLTFLNASAYTKKYTFIALVHKKSLFKQSTYGNITFIEFPKSRTSYAYRLYYEYVYFKKLAKVHNVFFWLSLHDMTPSIGKVRQAVYCHNPSPFNTLNIKDIYVQPTQFFFRLFYKYLYQINIKKNKYVIVQQLWMKHKFESIFHLNGDQIITAPPEIPKVATRFLENNTLDSTPSDSSKKMFFFPTFPRPFKNIEVICEAMKLVAAQKKENLTVVITIDGSENTYAKTIVQKYGHVPGIKFVGLLKREEVYAYYAACDGLIFPSKLETWGLPISECKQFYKPMFVSDLPYARETVGEYDQVCFFNPDDPLQLSALLMQAIENRWVFNKTYPIAYEDPFAKSWETLFEILLKE